MTTTDVTKLANDLQEGSLRLVTTIDDLFPADCDCIGSPLEQAITDGYVRRQVHPNEPLVILNYTEKTAYEEAWTPVTLACRGLIYRTDTGEVVARGFTKFFNYGQKGAPVLGMDASVLVTDKKDGSLGIIYPLPSGGYAVATRGSFASDQAIHATQVLHERYDDYKPALDVTTLVEIVFPTNRIVLDYGAFDDLVLLGGQPLDGGRPIPPASMHATSGWSGPVTETLLVGPFAEALALPNRVNAEGAVVHDLTTGALVKIKQADYVELHRIVTNLTARRIHDWLVEGKLLGDFIAPLPDEFHAWCREVADGISTTVRIQQESMAASYDEVVAQVAAADPDWTATDRAGRKEFALIAARHPDKWALFALLDGRDIRPELLKRADPGPFLTPTGRTYSEDNA